MHRAMIFINYRRDDTSGIVDRLHGDLVARFGVAAVFRDTKILAARWPDEVRRSLQECAVVLVVIGPGWESARETKEASHRHWLRLQIEEDWVRKELLLAFKLHKTLIPVLYNGARVPGREWLERIGLAPLANWMGQPLRDRNYHDYSHDLEAIVAAIRKACSTLPYHKPVDAPAPHGGSIPTQRDALLAAADANLRGNLLQEALQVLTQVSRDYWDGQCSDEISELHRKLAEIQQIRSDYTDEAEYREAKRRVNAEVASGARKLFHRLEGEPPRDVTTSQSVVLPIHDRPALVRARAVGLSLGQFTLESINLAVQPGRIVAVVGGNGSGKSTLLRILAHQWAYEEGELTYRLGPEGELTHDPVAISTRIGFVEQDPRRWRGRLDETLHLEAAQRFTRYPERQARVEYAIDRLGLRALKEQRWTSLSCGQRMRFELARVLVREPKLLVLDEPLAWLDPDIRERFLLILQQEARSDRMPKGVVLSSHHVEAVERFADEILCLEDGKVVVQGDVQSLFGDATTSVFEYAFSPEGASDVDQHLVLEDEDRVRHGIGRYIVTSQSRESSEEGLQRVARPSKLVAFRNMTHSVFRHFLSFDERIPDERDHQD